jgi:diguanylate cyclase (GGDEF)-like protein
MDRLRNWLCPTPEHRARMVEAGARIKKARMIVAGAIGAGVVIGTPWLGWWPIALFVPSAVYLVSMDRLLDRSSGPELIVLGTLLGMSVVLALSAALTGGPESPVLPWLALIPAMAALRFRWAVSRALAGVAGVLIVGVGVGVDPASVWDDPVMVVASLVMLASIVGVTTALMEGELEHRDRAVIDPLTALLNRSALETRIPELEQQARVTGGSVCLVLFDIDCFKRVNDTYGHERGDAALRDVAYTIRTALREFELVYRIGGEELLVVLPAIDLAGGIEVAERLRTQVADARPAGLDLTISAGVAAAAGSEVSYEKLFRAADEALLRAKREGRDRVTAARPPVAVAA